MRRRKPVSVRVKAPSRGLVTRLPDELADVMKEGDLKRACVEAQNVRFEDGVMANAPGFFEVNLTGPYNDEGATLIYQANYAQPDPYPLFIGAGSKLYLATRTYSADPPGYGLSFDEVYTMPGASVATAAQRWIPTDYFNKIIFAHKEVVPQVYTTGPLTADLPGLPDSGHYEGATAFANHLILWSGNTIKYSGLSDSSLWIPVAETVASFRLTTDAAFVQPLAGNTVQVFVAEPPIGITVDQYVRMAFGTADNFYTVTASTPVGELVGTTIAAAQSLPATTTTPLFLTANVAWEVGQLLSVAPSTVRLTVAAVSDYATTGYPVGPGAASVLAGTPRTATVSLAAQVTDFGPGDYVSIGPSTVPGVDVWKILTATQSGSYLVLGLEQVGTGLGTSPRVAGVGAIALGANVVLQPFVSLINATGSAVAAAASVETVEEYAITLRLEALTGRTDEGTSVTAGAIIESLDANEAGEVQIVGGSDNGNILQVVTLGDYAYILKNRSIQAVQYVGRLSGTFFMRTEVRDEGLIGRNAWLRLGDNRLIFVGNREIYDYRGGSTLTPIIQQFSRQMFAELDRGRIHEVFLHHKEARNEVWIVYPITGGTKVLVWNYVEDTATLDVYDTYDGAIAAIGQTRWSTDPSWLDMAVDWDHLADYVTWESLSGSGEELQTVFGLIDGRFFIHGSTYSRDDVAYSSKAVTMDYDFGDPDVWKYVDVVVVMLDVRQTDNVARTFYVEVGGKETTDGVVTWTPRQPLQVQGAAQSPCKVNTGGAGRFIRLRFTSEDIDVPWRVSGFEIHGRAGATY